MSTTSLLIKSAFNLIFRQLENFILVSQALAADEDLCASGKVKDCFFYLALASGQFPFKEQDVKRIKPADSVRLTQRMGAEAA